VFSMTRNFLLVATAFSFFAQGAAADDSIESRFVACAAESDEAARLSCFDRAAEALEPPDVVAEPQAAAPIAALQPEPAPSPEPVSAAAATPAPSPESASAPAAAPGAPVDPVAQFGMNPELASQQETQKVELDEITAVAVEVTKRIRGEHVVTLDNGQVWTEKDAESYFRVKVGDTVIIKKISMGGYRMVGRGNRSSAVKRIK
jgi:hypothetical protein